MHTVWKGSISFGLVNIPIKLYAATEDKDIKLRSLHSECHTPIKYEKYCPVCEESLDKEEIVKGYEYEQGRFVILEEEDMKELSEVSNKMIEIVDFVKLEEIDPIYFNRSYFIGPNENGGKPYSLLRKAMEETGKIGVAKVTMRSKESLAVVRVFKNGLLLETIHYPDEVRQTEWIPDLPENVELDEKELDMARQLIDQLTTEFNPDKFKDEYREAMMELIDSKVSGEEVAIPKKAPERNVVDLMEALQASIDKSQTKPKKKTDTAKKKQPPRKKKSVKSS